jgi:hypothetical protein
MATEETRKLLKAFGIAVTDYEDALGRTTAPDGMAKIDAELRARSQQVNELIERLRKRAPAGG